MAHVIKYTKSVVGHMFNHYGRSDDKEKAGYVIRGNENINPDKTDMNYNLASRVQPMKQIDFLHQRLNEIKVHNRKDVNVMVDWVVTLPQSIDNLNDEERFFRETYEFLNNRYGKENVISAYVHKDEVTPHMHYAFIPIVEDRKKGGYKLSAKETITRKELQTFHQDLSKHMQHIFGRDIGVLNEATKEGNRSIQELKRESAIERLHRVTSEASKIVSEARLEAQVIKDTTIVLKAEYEAKKAYLEKMAKSVPNFVDIEIKKGIFDKQEYAKVPIDVWNAKNTFANTGEACLYANKEFDDKIKSFQESISAEHFKNLSKRVEQLESENTKLKDRAKEINQWYKTRVNTVLNSISPTAKNEFVTQWKEVEEQAKTRCQEQLRKQMEIDMER